MKYLTTLLLLLLPYYGLAEKLLTFDNIKVSELGRNASEAKLRGFESARIKAFQTLLLTSLDQEKIHDLPAFSKETIESLIVDVKVVEETSASNHYAANMTVTFDSDAVNLLIFDIKTYDSKDSYLILPIFSNQSGDLELWQQTNIWRKQWEEVLSYDDTQETFYIPFGDLEDIENSKYDVNLNLDKMNIDFLKQKYNVKYIVPILAYMTTVSVQGGQAIKMQMQDPKTGILRETQFVLQYNKSDWHDAVRKAMNMINGDIADDSNQNKTTRANMQYHHMRDWVAIKAALLRDKNIDKLIIIELGGNVVTFDMHHKVTQDELELALTKIGFKVYRENDLWNLGF